MKKKRKLKKKNILLLFIILLLICIIIYLLNIYNSNEFKLRNVGYNTSEIKIISKLSDDEIKIILENKYQPLIVDLVSNENYKSSKLKSYIKSLNSCTSIDEIFKSTKKENNNQVEDTNTLTYKLKQEKYYIDKNLDRYVSYLNIHSDYSYEEIVRCVNAGIDSEFYTNVKSADTSKGDTMLVNKYNALDESYIPNLVTMESAYTASYAQMESVAYSHFKEMVDAARKDNIKLYNVSAYRSYQAQSYLYNNYVNQSGQSLADTFSARAGYSEHQTGLATDINTASIKSNFENTKEYEWLINNSYKYGFILRYPKDKEYITGYRFEPWHYRYVGVEVATYIKENQITYEEYYAYFIMDK